MVESPLAGKWHNVTEVRTGLPVVSELFVAGLVTASLFVPWYRSTCRGGWGSPPA